MVDSPAETDPGWVATDVESELGKPGCEAEGPSECQVESPVETPEHSLQIVDVLVM
jgi:hypothetical protein